jgi:hypothetical protein
MSRVALLIACLSLGALGGYLASSRMAPDRSGGPGPAEPSPDIAALHAELSALRAQLEARSGVGQTARPQDHGRPTAQTRAEAFDEAARWQGLYERKLAAARDAAWAPAREAEVREYITRSPEWRSYALTEVRCGAELCRMELESRAVAGIGPVLELLGRDPFGFGSFVAADEDDPSTLVAFVPREKDGLAALGSPELAAAAP